MKKLIALSAVVIMAVANISAQNAVTLGNIIKYNLTPTAFGIYTIQYERVVNPKQTVGISFSLAPNIDLPFKQTLLDQFGDNEQAVTAINSTTFNNFSITPEYRFYVGSATAPVGFYLSSFMRYSHMVHEQTYMFTDSKGEDHYPFITTTFNGFGVGEMIGIQWAFGTKQNFVLDWWIVGPYFGILKGNSHGTGDMSDMDDEDRAKLETDIEGIDIPLWEIDATVGNDVVDAELNGAYYGMRLMGLCFGVRF